MHRAKFVTFFIALIIVVTFLVGCTGEKQESKLKVALLQFGDIGDYGWTYEAHVGGQQVAEFLSHVKLAEREPAEPGSLP